ncbi:hypothetical protein [Paenibacillus chitinolyticus]|uniref:hypothetical protein n=1 Tax=Paenibacillus chitinolyticus TaxID=79263 RepID=UPI00366C4074
MNMTPEMQTISQIIAANAPMTLEQIIKLEIDEWRRSKKLELMKLGQEYYRADHDVLDRKRELIGENGRKVEDANLSNKKLVHTYVRKLVDQKTVISFPSNCPYKRIIRLTGSNYQAFSENRF